MKKLFFAAIVALSITAGLLLLGVGIANARCGHSPIIHEHSGDSCSCTVDQQKCDRCHRADNVIALEEEILRGQIRVQECQCRQLIAKARKQYTMGDCRGAEIALRDARNYLNQANNLRRQLYETEQRRKDQ